MSHLIINISLNIICLSLYKKNDIKITYVSFLHYPLDSCYKPDVQTRTEMCQEYSQSAPRYHAGTHSQVGTGDLPST